MADYISTHTGAQIDAAVDAVSTKQDLLTAGTGIDITDNTVSTTIVVPTKVSDLENDSSFVSDSSLSEALSEKQDVLTAGDNITITDNVISATGGNDWYGTQREFDALAEYDPDTNYFISDRIEYSEIKGAPNMANYYMKAAVDAKDRVLDGKIASKTEISYMTQEEFDDITPLEGKVYAIEGITKTFTVTYSDETTETFNVVVD